MDSASRSNRIDSGPAASCSADNADWSGNSLALQFSQQTSGRIQAKHHDLVRILVGHEQHVARGCQSEVPWGDAQARLEAHQAHQAAGCINSEDHKTVMPAIGGIEPLAIGVNLNLGGSGLTAEIGWNCGYRLEVAQDA